MSTTRVSDDLKHIRIPLDDIGLDDTLRFALSPDYIIATVEKKILVYSSLDFRLIRSLECGKGRITGVDVYQNVLVTCLIDRSIHIWDLRSGKCLHTLTGYIPSFFIVKPELVEVEENSILAKEKWPRKPLIVTSSPLKSWVNSIWSLNEDTSKNLELLHEIYGQPFLSTGFAAKGRTAATAGYDCTVRVWDHTDRDNTVRIWDIQTGECRHILKSHTAMVSEIRALPSRWVSLS
ncbi:WD40-repeat-containing domain protein, partial [Gymnopilus junonius]